MASFLLFAISCSSIIKKGTAKASIDSEKGTISVSLNNMERCHYNIKIYEYDVAEGVINGKEQLDVLGKIRSQTDIAKDIALLAAKNNNELSVSLCLTDVLDTVFTYHLTPTPTQSDDIIQFSGIGARIVPKSASRNVDEELKRWLYHKHEVVKDSLFGILRANYIYLTESNNNDFVVKGEIPVLHSIAGNKYSVSCSMQADYYALVACNNQPFIERFVENAVVADYKNLSTSKSSLICKAQDFKNGYLCLMLLGINKDYSFQQVPIALVALDNSAPSQHYHHSETVPNLSFKNKTTIIIPSNAPKIHGVGEVSVPHWDGNGLECNVSFDLNFIGDCKSITIQRRGDLCYYSPFTDSYLFKPENKTFYAKDYKNSHNFTWKMHFDDGDNEIPVIVEDYHGNKASYKVVVRASFVRNNSPQIDIDNNIEINN